MIDSSRLERNLIAAARRYAPALVPMGWQSPGDYRGALPDLARTLASFNVLVLTGNIPQPAVKAWTDGYTALYSLLAGVLFPSYLKVSAFYLDQETPPMVGLYGEATPVIVVMAGFVAPYVVARQGMSASEVEVYGMMDMILEELEATDLPREDYRRLRDGSAVLVRGLLEGAGQQLPLTPPARPIFDTMAAQRGAAPANVPVPPQSTPPPMPLDLPEPPPPPPDLPEYLEPPPPVAPEPEAPKRKFDPDSVPIFFNPSAPPRGGGGTNFPAAPNPPLPPRDKR